MAVLLPEFQGRLQQQPQHLLSQLLHLLLLPLLLLLLLSYPQRRRPL